MVNYMNRSWRSRFVQFLLVLIIVMFIITSFLSIKLLTKDQCINYIRESKTIQALPNVNITKHTGHRLAILVPFRERFEELLIFVPYISKFLNEQRLDYSIFILHQIDRYRFNRASLINVGFLYTKHLYDYIAMHDVDLLPLNKNLSYAYPKVGPFHIAAPNLHPRYNYNNFVGGILLVKREHFSLVDGMSNKYWGWGLEDDEFYVRLRQANLTVKRPSAADGVTSGRKDTFRHIHDRKHRRRDTTKCFDQREITRKRDRDTGVRTVRYDIRSVQEVLIEGAPCRIINIVLKCNRTLTPWCNCTDAPVSQQQSVHLNQKT